MVKSWHDSKVAAVTGFYKQLIENTPRPYAVVVDSAFLASNELFGKILRPRKDGEAIPENAALREVQEAVQRSVISVRQGAEWGMRTLQGTFARFIFAILNVD